MFRLATCDFFSRGRSGGAQGRGEKIDDRQLEHKPKTRFWPQISTLSVGFEMGVLRAEEAESARVVDGYGWA